VGLVQLEQWLMGHQTMGKVDVITGPGRIFVATAKKLVYGDVNIDMIAGPSEIGVIADSSADASHIASEEWTLSS